MPMHHIVLLGHRHQCPEHGEGAVTSASTGLLVNGRVAAGVGDTISCGAVIVSGAPSVAFSGRSVARVGDITSHGGVLIEGDEGFGLE
ncbi:PAAR domain-containing protein [Paraburkholderia terrae]|uniref:PAAR domain-containing protein n=1 Tax=Paraburkholderia terrae TaxID=311230 RepID=UPI00285282A4|nr:PAAR domain-containing protein [Paraburkholderia terrae]